MRKEGQRGCCVRAKANGIEIEVRCWITWTRLVRVRCKVSESKVIDPPLGGVRSQETIAQESLEEIQQLCGRPGSRCRAPWRVWNWV